VSWNGVAVRCEPRSDDNCGMGSASLLAILLFVANGSGTHARFSVDGVASTPSVTIATIQPRTGAPGYAWLRIYFYSAALTPDDEKRVAAGHIGLTKWSAVLQLTLDKDSRVWQVDLSLPGHTCTIAGSDVEAKQALQDVQFDGNRLRIQGRGSYVCDMRPLAIPKSTYEWDVTLDVAVLKG